MGIAKAQVIAVGAVAALGAAWYLGRGAGGMAEDVTRTGVNVAGGVVTGAIHGASDLVGLPTPEHNRCQQAKMAGDTFEASVYCTAGDFLTWWWSK